MPLTGAERQKRFREKQKLNAETLEKYKKQKHEYYVKARKPIALANDREKRRIRRGWNKAQQEHRARIKRMTADAVNMASPVSSSPDSDNGQAVEPPPSVSTGAIRQRYLRRIKCLNVANKKLKNKLRSVEKQCWRLRKKTSACVAPTSATTPRSKTKYVM